MIQDADIDGRPFDLSAQKASIAAVVTHWLDLMDELDVHSKYWAGRESRESTTIDPSALPIHQHFAAQAKGSKSPALHNDP